MRLPYATAALSVAASLLPKAASWYIQTENYIGSSFLEGFGFQNISDPTHGRVAYVDEGTAFRNGLVSFTLDTFTLRADHTTVLSPDGPGRESFRIISNRQYNTHVAIFDVLHMPAGCGTWPAIWELGDNWPHDGEIDVVEGVNNQGPNQSTLHTDAGCNMTDSRLMKGTSVSDICDVALTNNGGCGVRYNNTADNYGPPFNANKGGWYAVEKTDTVINLYFWARDDDCVPLEVKFGAPVINPETWGLPTATFTNTLCDIKEHFKPQNIIINLTFCGDWAGNPAVYASSGCPSTCVDYVNNNPTAFKEAYFEFAGISIYEHRF